MKQRNNNINNKWWSLFLAAAAVVLVAAGWLLRESAPAAGLPELPRLAYMISGGRVERLLRAVYHRRNYYLVHVDLEEERVRVAALGLENVMVLGRPNVVTAKGPTELAATLQSAAILLKKAPQWDWFINLCASDYPLLSQHDLLHVLSYLPRDLNFLDHTSNLGWKENQIARPIIIDSGLYHSKKSAIFWAKERRSLPASFKLFMGSSGVMLSKAMVELCVWGWDNLPRTLLIYYTNTLSSSESYFHTVACNHKDFQNTTVNHDLRFSVFDDAQSPPNPVPLTHRHLHHMILSGAPFARNVHQSLLDTIDAQLLSCTPSKTSCWDRSHPDVVKPSLDSNRLQKLLLKLLHPQNFRPNQCN